jgi:drug/metabolite transporter (DMT)-like permease
MLWIVLATVSALLSAAAAVTQKKVLMRAHALEFSFLVSFVIMILSFAVPVAFEVAPLSWTTLLFILGKSVIGGVAFLLVMMALERDQISSVLPLLGLTPAVTALLAWGVLGETLGEYEWLGIGLMVVGTYLLERRPVQWRSLPSGERHVSPVFYCIGGALLLFALSSVADQMLISGGKADPRVVLLYQHIVYCVMFGSLLVVRKASLASLLQKGREHWPFLLAIAVLTIGYRFTQLEAVKYAPVALVLAVKRTSILYASLVGGKLFSDKHLGLRIAGALLIVASGFIILRNVA